MSLPLNFERELLAALPRLRSYACHLCRNRDDADDLLQSTIVLTLTHRAKFELGTNFRAWATAIMRSVLRGERARAKTRRAVIAELERARDLDGEDETEPFEGTAVGNPEQAIIVAEGYTALSTLKPTIADILVDVGGHGHSLEATAEKFGLPVNTIKSHLHRGRAQLLAATGGI